MSFMGVGTNILGYGHPEIDEAVLQIVLAGNLPSLKGPEEVFLRAKQVEIHGWAVKLRLARIGGDANAIAIRIARAAAEKDKVATCGYYGWHDWYLSANINDRKSLDGHLLPGLEPKGAPENLLDTLFPCRYNDFAGLESLVSKHDIGLIKMEVVRNTEPQNNFLHKIRDLVTKHSIALVFD